MQLARAAALTALLAVTGCGGATVPRPAPAARTAGCHARGELPDPTCTPGASNPAVSQGTIAATICAPGWTATVRPPASYTDALKRRQMAAYRLTGPPAGIEEDHLIPLELGGAPTDPRNLWPEPLDLARDKDRVENAARRAVCAHRIPLDDARAAITRDWVSFGHQLGV